MAQTRQPHKAAAAKMMTMAIQAAMSALTLALRTIVVWSW
jgi:hypothetical protein